MIENYLIIFFPLVDWDAPWQRYQHFATAFSQKNEVIYLEPAASINYLLRRPALLRKKLFCILKGGRQITRNLFVTCSPPILPFGYGSHIINSINQFFILLLIKISIRVFNQKKNLLLWINDPIHYPLIKWFKPKLSVYDCTDAFVFPNPKRQDFHDNLRHTIIMRSNISFFTSQLFLEEGKRYSHNGHYVPNGVDIKNFNRRRFPIPKEMKNIKKPILGFVGSLDSRIDQDLMKDILVRRRDISLVLVGPVLEDFSKIEKIDRVFFMGKKSYREIPLFIEQFDVALIPYLPEKSQAVYPVKLHEYLILGKPVVSTKINEIKQFSEVVYIANNREAFIDKIELALRERNAKKRKERIQTALENTWSVRLNKVDRELTKIVGN